MLYNLAQPDAVIIVRDQLWMSETWAGMLVGADARRAGDGAGARCAAPRAGAAGQPNDDDP